MYMKSIQVCEDLGLKLLTYKLVMLMALLSSQRAQSLQLLDIGDMTLLPDKVTFYIKQSRVDLVFMLSH